MDIVSAGLSDIVITVLDQCLDHKNYKNLNLISNELVFGDNNTTISDLNVNIISVGKDLVMTNERVKNRKNFLVLGDMLTDTNVVR